MMKVITQPEDWSASLDKVDKYDFYHTYDYHILGKASEDEAVLIEFSEEDTTVLLPLILRHLPCGLDQGGLLDATSVYGYAGPLIQGDPKSILKKYRSELRNTLASRGIVSVFSRLHPVLSNSIVIDGLGEISSMGSTISIDLTQSPEEQWLHYRKNNRYDIRKLIAEGVECRELDWEIFGDDFISIYNETMHRVHAQQSYIFPRSYYDQLFQMKAATAHLFGCFKDGDLICAGIFMLCQGIVQYHLSGTSEAALHLGPTRLMLDTARIWGKERGAQVLHLGGGVGGQRDSLFNFKAGFSKREHDFQLWRWVVDSAAYAEICATVGRPLESTFFPAYRAPT